MDSLIFKAANELAETIQAAVGDLATVSVVAVPNKTIAELKNAVISVAPRAERVEIIARGIQEVTLEIDVGIQRKVKGDAEIDSICALAETVSDAIFKNPIPSATWTKQEIQPILDAGGILSEGVATSVISLTFKTAKRV